MIRYKNVIVSLINQHARLSSFQSTRKFSTPMKKPTPEVSSVPEIQQKPDEKEEKKRQEKSKEFMRRALILKGSFEQEENKSRETFIELIKVFEEKEIHRRNHVEFIYAALKNMTDYNLQHDLKMYKRLIDVMPKGKFIPTNIFQAEFMHYPKQQQCIIDLLEQMEDNGVIPDYEMEDMLINIFGRKGHPVRKFWRMMYWMPKFKNISPWPVPNPAPNDALELAKLALERMCSVDTRSEIKFYETKQVESAIDDTWIVSGQSVEQRQLLSEHKRDHSLYIEGPHLIWLRNKSVSYFVLKGDNHRKYESITEEEMDDVSDIKIPLFGFQKSKRNAISHLKSVHEQDDGVIYAICCTGMSTKDSLLSWIRLLEKDGNPSLAHLVVLFKFKSAVDNKISGLLEDSTAEKSEDR